jgi:hypothetical protein
MTSFTVRKTDAKAVAIVMAALKRRAAASSGW